jgi:hypothetical protein
MAGDIVDKEAVFENTQVHFNAEQRWYYLSNQRAEELLIFKNADSEEESGGMPGEFASKFGFLCLFGRLLFQCLFLAWLTMTSGVPHASFDNPRATEGDVRRESIEFRVLVRW